MRKVSAKDPVWLVVAANLKEKIEGLQLSLERDADEVTTANLRGQLRALRGVLTWPEIGQNDEPTEGIEFT
jgi:hypothetical protein